MARHWTPNRVTALGPACTGTWPGSHGSRWWPTSRRQCRRQLGPKAGRKLQAGATITRRPLAAGLARPPSCIRSATSNHEPAAGKQVR